MQPAFYRRLTRAQRATCRRSDAVADVPLRDTLPLRAIVRDLEAALGRGDRAEVESCCNELAFELCEQLGVPLLRVTVRDVRPEEAGSELHGLYEWAEGKLPQVQVWMRTRAHERVVAFRTFLRTLLHEVVHHLDFTAFGFDESFHTPGFFRRESSLVRQLLPTPPPARARPGP